jgi:hypothetical protein
MLCIEDWWPFYGRAIKALSYGSAIKQPILITQPVFYALHRRLVVGFKGVNTGVKPFKRGWPLGLLCSA